MPSLYALSSEKLQCPRIVGGSKHLALCLALHYPLGGYNPTLQNAKLKDTLRPF